VRSSRSLKLRPKLRWRWWKKLGVDDGRWIGLGVGEAWLETSSALPSRESERRTEDCDWGWLAGCDASGEWAEGGKESSL
jgi:hypothetical protein